MQREIQRPKAIQSYRPMFDEEYIVRKDNDPNRERAEIKKLKRQIARERKGAAREIKKDSLDNLINLQNKNLIFKIDVERHELKTIKGAKRILSKISGQKLTIDTTGAGDMYAAGFLSSISKGHSPFLAASNASILAEEIIKIHGAQFEKLDIRVLKEKIFN